METLVWTRGRGVSSVCGVPAAAHVMRLFSVNRLPMLRPHGSRF